MFLPSEDSEEVTKVSIQTKTHIYTVYGEDSQLWLDRIKFLDERCHDKSINSPQQDTLTWNVSRNAKQWISNKWHHLHLVRRGGYETTSERSTMIPSL